MGSKWRKVKMALGSNFCVYVPTDNTEDSPPQSGRFSGAALLSPASEQWNSGASAAAPRPWSPALRLSKSLSRSSKKCTICLTSMKRGEGQAIFTAECSHSFHFHCIASNVKHGNQICPVCRAKWKEVPLQGSAGLDIPLGGTQISPINWAQDNPVMTIIRPFPQRQNSNRRVAAPIFPLSEPAVFNDDEALDLQSSTKNIDTTDGSSFKRLLLETYTEVPAVSRLTVVNDFTVMVHLKAPVSTFGVNSGSTVSQVNQNSRAPVDLVTVLDISGSMAGTKLALLKRAMGFVIQNLGPADRLAVIAFSSTARRLFPLRKMSDTGKQHALQAVNSLVANGGTNIAEGLRKSGKVMEDRREKNPVASIILLSDGQDTYTVGSSLVSGSTQNRSNKSNLPLLIHPGVQIPVHAFGFGADHDATLMHSISEVSRGTFSFIETESVIQDAFAQCIGGLLSVVVKGLQVIIESANPNILLRSLKAGSYKNQLMPDRKSGCIDVGDLYADEERDFLVSINIPEETGFTFLNETSLLKVNCYYTDPLTKETVKLVSENVTIKRPENLGKENVVSIKVDKQRNRLQSAEAMEQARIAAEEGDLTRAVSILENFRKVLSESVSAKSGDRLCMALDAELKEMQDRMASRHMYEHSGRAYVLSGLSSHSWQRATARGDSTDGASLVQAYQTPSMTEMLTRSQANLVQPAWSSLTSEPRPR
uniref:E3 ubiquitin-protein ligase WAV3-like n=1 Tax=Erigeron canadensis TaxID=72917 RepID=UPI001CB8C83D|nr:E3 ubiquitin-protein ligase WAV3-like [Erigeron canadensis]